MNGRLYDPVLGRMLSPDNYVQMPDFTQNFNRYAYAWNNPLIYTDPSGEFLQIAFTGMAFMAEMFSNLAQGYVDGAWNNATTAVNGINSCLQIPIHNNGSSSLSIGISPLALGVSINMSSTVGNVTTNMSFGVGIMSGPFASGGITYDDGNFNIRIGGGIGSNYKAWGLSASYKGYGAGYYQTYYGNDIGPDGVPNKQMVGGFSLSLDRASIRIENDFMGDGRDRWRSGAFAFGFDDFEVGFNVYTDERYDESDMRGWVDEVDYNGKNLLGKTNKHGKGAWRDGQVYSSPAWIGIRSGGNISRVGINNKWVQDRFQNWIHRNGFLYMPFGYQHFWNKYDKFDHNSPFGYRGFYNPYSLF